MNINLIECSDHKLAPWSVVCIHLIIGKSKEWVPIESENPEVDFDWTCPDCVPDTRSETMSIENFRPVCIHCVRFLRNKFDLNFEKDTEYD